MLKKIIMTASLFILLVPAVGFTMGECRDDRKKFCPDAGLNEDKIKACLKANYPNLSAICKQMIDQKVEEKIEKKMESQSK